VVAFMLAPLVVVCLVAFTPTDTLQVPWGDYSLRWFRAVFEHGDLVQSFWNSLGVAALAATRAVVLAVPAALAIARHEFPGRQALNGLLMSPLIVPHLVLGVAMLRLFALLEVRGSSLWLTLAHVVIVTPYALRLMVAALAGAGPQHRAGRAVAGRQPLDRPSAASRCR
jgi:putative spermidine/putrescine transport system permease protein